MAFSHKYNYDNSVIRAMIVGLLGTMNKRINYEQTYADDTVKTIRVAFFPAQTGDERAIQDAYIKDGWSDCVPDFIEGNYDYIPRGMVQFQGINILGNEITSRFVRGYYHKEVDGELKRYNSYINSIPIQVNFNCEVIFDTQIEGFMIVESSIKELFKTLVFNVQHKGFMIPCRAGFPENFEIQRLYEFTYASNDARPKVTFPIEAHGFLPIPDPKEEMFAGTTIQKFSETYHTLTEPKYKETIDDQPFVGSTAAGVIYPPPSTPGTPEPGQNPNGGGSGNGPDSDTSEFSGNKWQ